MKLSCERFLFSSENQVTIETNLFFQDRDSLILVRFAKFYELRSFRIYS